MTINPIRTAFGLSNTYGLQRNFQTSQTALDRTLQRLSTGLRLNSAADDPVNFTRARNFETRALSTLQARENSQEAALLFQTASDGAGSILGSLQRIRELTLLSMTATTSNADRTGIQTEVDLLLGSIDRTAQTTTFNGRNLLNGSAASTRTATDPSASILSNSLVTNSSGTRVDFLSGISNVDTGITAASAIEFELFESSPGVTGLEVRSSNLGTIATYNDVSTLGSSLTIPVNSLSGAGITVDLPSLGSGGSGTPITAADVASTDLNTLVSNGQLNAITFGQLDLTLGGTLYSNVIDVQGSNTIQDILDAINGLSPSNGSVSASFNATNSTITVDFTGQDTLTEVTNAAYNPTDPGAAGGPVSSFSLLGAPGEGPAYRDPTSFLPSTSFTIGSPPAGTVFPTVPASLDSSLNFSGTDASILSVFGLSNTATSNELTTYTASFSGETVATINTSEFINRTLVSIESVTSNQNADGSNTGLTAADADLTFEALNTAKVDVTPFASGDFTIDFGDNGVFNSATDLTNAVDGSTGFDVSKTTIQDIEDAINNFSANTSASFDVATNTLQISNTPTGGGGTPQVTDPGLVAGTVTIDFGSNGSQTFAFDPSVDTIDTVVNKITALDPNITASFAEGTDTLSITNSPADIGTKLTDPGFGTGDLTIDFGENGILTISDPLSLSIDDIVSAIDGFAGGNISASFDAATDSLSITNSPADIGTKITDPGLVAGSFDIDFGENGTLTLNFDPTTDSISDVVSAIDGFAGGNISASFDAATDTLAITNSPADIGTKLTDPGGLSGDVTLDFGDNGSVTLTNLASLSIDDIVAAIDGVSANVSASFDAATDTLAITNTPADLGTKLTSGLSAGTFDIDFGENGTLSLTVDSTDSIADIVSAIDGFAGGNISASFDDATDTLSITNSPADIGTKLTDPGGLSGDLDIDFGENGTLTINNPEGLSINDIVSQINSFDANTSASFDVATDMLLITNSPADIGTKLTDTGFGTGDLTIDFGSNGVLTISDPASMTINEIVSAIDSFDANISASFDAATDTLSITNTSSVVGSKIDDPGFGVLIASQTIDFGDNGSLSLPYAEFGPLGTIDYIVGAIDAVDGVSASFDTDTDTLTITNTPDIKVNDPGLVAGTISIDFGDNGTQTFAFDPTSDTIQDVVTAISGLDANISAAYDENTDTLTISNTPTGPVLVTDPGFVLNGSNVEFSINFGSNGVKNFSFDPTSTTLQGLVDMINTSDGSTATTGPSFIAASFDLATDRLTITNKVSGSGDRQITFTGTNAAQIKDFFNINDVADGSGSSSTTTSTAAIGNSDITTTATTIEDLISPTGDNQMTFLTATGDVTNDAATTALRDFFQLSNTTSSGLGTQTSTSSVSIDNGAQGTDTDITSTDVATTSLQTLTTGNNQIVFSDPAFGFDLRNLFKLTSVGNDGTGIAQSIVSSGDIDNSATDPALDITPADLGAALLALSFPVQGSNEITFGGAESAAFTSLFNVSTATDTSSGSSASSSQNATSTGEIDNSSTDSRLELEAGDLDTSLNSLFTTQVKGSNEITFGNTAAAGFQTLFNVSSAADTGAGIVQSVTSTGDIDNSGSDARLDLVAGDLGTSLSSLFTTQVQGNNEIVFEANAASADFLSLFNIASAADTGSGAAQSLTSTSQIDNGGPGSALDLTATDLATGIDSLASTQIKGTNEITLSGTGATAFQSLFNISGAADTGSGTAQTVTSTGDIDNSGSDGRLDLLATDTGTALGTLATTQVQGNNEIVFQANATSSGFLSLFNLSSAADTGSGASQNLTSTGQIDNGADGTALDLIATDLATAINTLATTQVQGSNEITFGGAEAAAFQTLFKVSTAADTGSGAAQNILSTAAIDNGADGTALDLLATDLGSTLDSLTTTQIQGSNAIQFAGDATSDALRQVFRLTNAADSGSGASQNIISAGDIDNSGTDPLLDLTAADVTTKTFDVLTTAGGGSGDNQITFGGVNGANISGFFNLSSVASDGSGNPQAINSSGDMSSQALDASLDISSGDVTGATFEELFTPKLNTLVSGDFIINGDTVLTIDETSDTINSVLSAINGLSSSGNQSYTSNFDSAVGGGLQINLSDTETLSAPGSSAPVDPGGTTPTVNGNQITLDSAAFIADAAPLSINGGTPLGSGSGPAEQTSFSTTALDPAFSASAPNPSSTDLSGISFGGATNIASVLFLNNASSGSATTVGSAEYQGIITPTGQNSFDLEASYRQTYQATSSATSTQTLGNTGGGGGIPSSELGVVARIFVQPGQSAITSDASLTFQVGPDQGSTFGVGISPLTLESLGLEGLNLIGNTDAQTYLLGVETLGLVDSAIDTVNRTNSILGATQNVLNRTADYLADQQVNLTQALSDIQDASLEEELSNLDRHKLVNQTAAAALSEARIQEERIFGILFGGSGFGRGGIF